MDLTTQQIVDIIHSVNQLKKKPRPDDSHWEVGSAYFIRTVTHHYTGRLVKVTAKELVIEDAAWIADDGRFAQFVAGGEANEIEPYPDGAKVIIGRGAILDAVKWPAKLPRNQK